MPKKTIFTPEMLTYFKKNRLKMSAADLGLKFGIGGGVVSRYLKKQNLQITRKESRIIASKKMIGRTNFSKKEDAFIKANYLKYPVKTLANMIGRSGCGVMGALKRMGLVIPVEIIEQRKKDSQKQPGSIPSNKGKKQVDYMTPEAIEKTKATRFKKGHIPQNSIGIKNGDITIRHSSKSRGSRPLKYIRISIGSWKELKLYNWEALYGEIPLGGVIRFKNGDSMNCDISNLELIDKKTNMALNTIQRYPDELQRSMRLLSKLKKTISKI